MILDDAHAPVSVAPPSRPDVIREGREQVLRRSGEGVHALMDLRTEPTNAFVRSKQCILTHKHDTVVRPSKQSTHSGIVACALGRPVIGGAA